MKLRPKPYRLAAVSGGFDPLHVGHLNLFRTAKGLAEKLVVIVECDTWIGMNKHVPLMPELDRMEIVRSVSYVDLALINYQLSDCGPLLSSLRPDLFVVGPDHDDPTKLPEYEACQACGIKVVCIEQLKKDRSSSEFLRRTVHAR